MAVPSGPIYPLNLNRKLAAGPDESLEENWGRPSLRPAPPQKRCWLAESDGHPLWAMTIVFAETEEEARRLVNEKLIETKLPTLEDSEHSELIEISMAGATNIWNGDY